jgi:putative FmdB family regulatory protein
MPIYEYRCRGCGKVHEVLQLKAGDAPTACPSCRATSLEKIYSVPAPSQTGGDAAPCESGSCSMGDSPDSCAMGGCCGGGDDF